MTTITIHVPDVVDQKAKILEVLEQIRAGRMSGETTGDIWWESEEDVDYDDAFGGIDPSDAYKEKVEQDMIDDARYEERFGAD